MTALTQFERLEATALWRPSADEQRREVVVSLGNATLTITDLNSVPLTHWSLGAVQRANPGTVPAIYHPDADPEETLEFGATESEMIAGLDRVLRAIERRRPKPGKLRLLLSLAFTAGLAVAGYLYVPDALERYTVTVVPDVKRAEIGNPGVVVKMVDVAGGRAHRDVRSRILGGLRKRAARRRAAAR